MTAARYCIFRHLPKFDPRASLMPLAIRLDAHIIEFDFFYKRWSERSWTLGHGARTFGNWFFRSTWNGLAPWVDERRFLRQIGPGAGIVHFLWGEFSSPRSARPYHRRGARVVGTFHCSARRLPQVLNGFKVSAKYDVITLMSRTQMPFFESAGMPRDRMRVILHGVDADFFRPADRVTSYSSDRLRLLLVGDTERDHVSAAQLFARLPADRFDIAVKTNKKNWAPYKSIPHVRLLPRMDGETLRQTYREADLLVMPLLDCTANNAVLESMACGTPVMVNAVGGVGEYVSADSNWILPDADIDRWVSALEKLANEPETLAKKRPAVRAWAERMDWDVVAPEYLKLYEEIEKG